MVPWAQKKEPSHLSRLGENEKLQQQNPLKHKSFIAGANWVALILSGLVSVSYK